MLTSTYWSEDCPPPEDRLRAFRHWSCEDYYTFRSLELALTIDVIVVKSLQIIVFGVLATKLVWRSFRRTGSLGCTPLCIAILQIMGGAAIIIACRESDNYYFNYPWHHENLYVISFFVGDFSTYLAMWLFGILVLETTIEIQRKILQGKQKSLDQETTKRYFKIANVSISILILFFNSCQLPGYMDSFFGLYLSYELKKTFQYLSIIG